MKNFWSNKKVLITGHTGFKGSWLTMILANFDAKLFGYSLPPTSTPNMFEALHIEDFMESSFYGDINDKSAFHNYLKDSDPEIIFHLAAQPIVNYSYQDPIGTYQTNVMGLLNLLEISKQIQSVETIVIVTSDKCYENKEIDYSYIETDKLGGYDPYSSSKAAAEILIQSYRQSFLEQSEHYSLSSARAGNVIGGGDWSMDRLIPDIVRYQYHEAELKLRYPDAIRPWQHVLDPLFGYLYLAKNQNLNASRFSTSWNFGPELGSERRNVKKICEYFLGNKISDIEIERSLNHEAINLQLNSSKSISNLDWQPQFSIDESLKLTKDWYETFYTDNKKIVDLTFSQIQKYNFNA